MLWCNYMFLCVLQNLHKQLEEAIQDGEIWVMQLKDTEYELEGSRERVQQQATEILHKASEMCFYIQYIMHSCFKGKHHCMSTWVILIIGYYNITVTTSFSIISL